MFHFTIRDLLWLMVVVGFAVCWYLERDGRIEQSRHLERIWRENGNLKTKLESAEFVRRLEEFERLRQTRPRPTISN
jgi:hypothetical protein